MNQRLSYWVDRNNIIQKVDEHWDNSMNTTSWSDRACSKGIIGKSLLEFICDDVTRMYVITMINSVRIIPQSLFRPYRCDSPDTKRFMQMIITPEDNGWVRVSHELLRCEPLKKTVLFKTKSNEQNSILKKRDFVHYHIEFVRCSLCNRLRPSDTDVWQEADSLTIEKSKSLNSIPVVYGICPDCLNSNI